MKPEWQTSWFNEACIDLRPATKYQAYHIANTTSLPWQRLAVSMHELPDRHVELQLLGSEEDLQAAHAFLLEKGYTVSRSIPSSSSFWSWAHTEQLVETGCQSIPLWQANPLLAKSIVLIESSTPGRTALDLACGAGRDAVFLARRGWQVTAIDHKADALQRCQSLASNSQCEMTTRQLDLETDADALGEECYDLILVMRYLFRPLLPTLMQHLKPGGIICYSTFMVGAEQFGSPRNPNYLLQPGELAEIYQSLKILVDEKRHLADGRPVSRFVAQRQ